MKRLLCILPLLLIATHAIAEDVRVGKLVSTGTAVNNLTTATPFTLSGPRCFAVQCNADVYVAPGGDSSTAATTDDVRVSAFALYDVCTNRSALVLSMLPVSAGTVSCSVFRGHL
jgi:hypothetical protein